MSEPEIPKFERIPGRIHDISICFSKLGDKVSAASSSVSRCGSDPQPQHRAGPAMQPKPSGSRPRVPRALHWAAVVRGQIKKKKKIHELIKDADGYIRYSTRAFDPEVDGEFWVVTVGKMDLTETGLAEAGVSISTLLSARAASNGINSTSGKWAISTMSEKYNTLENNCQDFVVRFMYLIRWGPLSWPKRLLPVSVESQLALSLGVQVGLTNATVVGAVMAAGPGLCCFGCLGAVTAAATAFQGLGYLARRKFLDLDAMQNKEREEDI
ncbi:hypothetical protein C8F01DRAFT_268099 [Mycena amicta]|nr:hypothetical protein C8F01DRAFT_268099 [Mycena amicta]